VDGSGVRRCVGVPGALAAAAAAAGLSALENGIAPRGIVPSVPDSTETAGGLQSSQCLR